MTSFQKTPFGKYLLIDKVGVGGMAEVYIGKITGEEGFEKLLVIKKILPHLTTEDESVINFIDEAKVAALLQHENIIHVYDFGNIEDSYFIAMEFLFGKDLHLVIKKSLETPIQQASMFLNRYFWIDIKKDRVCLYTGVDNYKLGGTRLEIEAYLKGIVDAANEK